jgi:glycosyltransferase involved in cell wall biosynthesis
MIIGIDASRANRSKKTGTEWYSYHLIKHLAKIDRHNQYILYSDEPLESGLAELCQKYSNIKSKVLKWPIACFWTLGRLTWEMIVRPPDVLFVPAHVLPLLSRARLVNTIHDVGFMALPKLYSRQAACYLRWSTSWALARARRLIAISEFTKQEIQHYFRADQSKIEVIYNGYDHELYKPEDKTVDDNQSLEKYKINQPYLLYIGRLESKKNIIGLLNSFRLYCQNNLDSQLKLVLVGKRSPDFSQVNNLLSDPILAERCLELGWIPEAVLPSLLRQAQAFVFPSWYEGFGLPVIQAMASGTPVLAAKAGSLPEIGGEAALYFDPADALDLADKIKLIIEDNNLRQCLIKAGLKRAVSVSWTKTAQETLAILEKCHDS